MPAGNVAFASGEPVDIIGSGFIARHFERIRHAHPHVLIFASGVSRSSCTDEREFLREVDLLYSAIHHCRTHKRMLVYFSTSSDLMYGGPDSQGLEDEPIFPRSAYGRHKLAMEAVIRQSGVAYLILRLANPVGHQQQPYQLVPALYHQIQQGVVQIRRNVRRDIIDIVDAISVIDELLNCGVYDQVVNIASGVAVQIEDIVDHLTLRVSSLVLRSYIDGTSHYRVSNTKLLSLLKNPAAFRFDQTYYKRVIDTYYPCSALQTMHVEPSEIHNFPFKVAALAT